MDTNNNNNPAPVAPPPYYTQHQMYYVSPASLVSPPYMQQQQGLLRASTRTSSSAAALEYIARGVAILATVAASVIIVKSKQSDDYYYDFTYKFTTYSAFLYFLAANILVLIYSIVSLMSILINPAALVLRLSHTIADIIAVSVLLNADGAASAVIARLDNIDHLSRRSVCSVHGKFCSHVKVSIASSMLAVGIYLALIIFSFVNSHKRN